MPQEGSLPRLHFKGKVFVENHYLAVPFHELLPVREKGLSEKANSPIMRDWLGRVVDRDDLTRHDKWCCMMMPRLKLLRELLRDDSDYI